MTEQGDIINRLLDKYENSRHLSDPGTSPRRVMLKVEKRDLPAYIYEDAVIRDAYNEAALELEKKHLVQLEWVKGRPVLSAIVLRLDQIPQCYASAERVHPKVRATQVIQLIDGSLKDVAIPWIIAWKADVCRLAAEQLKIPAFCRTDDTPLQDLLCVFREYAALSGSITMRAFSSKCFPTRNTLSEMCGTCFCGLQENTMRIWRFPAMKTPWGKENSWHIWASMLARSYMSLLETVRFEQSREISVLVPRHTVWPYPAL